MNNNHNKHNFIEVCAGCGGLSSGFMNEGFHPIFLNEIDKYCCETLKLNHSNTEIMQKSMEEIDLDKYKSVNIDILMGGVPCQSFSQIGKRKGLDDDRGNLMLSFINMISILKPKVFLIFLAVCQANTKAPIKMISKTIRIGQEKPSVT